MESGSQRTTSTQRNSRLDRESVNPTASRHDFNSWREAYLFLQIQCERVDHRINLVMFGGSVDAASIVNDRDAIWISFEEPNSEAESCGDEPGVEDSGRRFLPFGRRDFRRKSERDLGRIRGVSGPAK